MCLAFGGIIPNIIAGLLASLTDYYQYAFFFPSMLGLIVSITSIFLEEKSESLDKYNKLPFKSRFALTIKTLR
jgi:sugar phosphate permease